MPLNPPAYLQAGTYTASLDRQYLITSDHYKDTASPDRARNGLLPAPMARSAAMSSTGWVVTVGPYHSIVSNGYAANAGDYKVISTGNEAVTLAGSSPTTNRIDVIGVAVEDAFYSGSANQGSLAVVQGTPSAGTPVTPTLPATFFPLYGATINANSTTPVFTDVRRRTAPVGAVANVFPIQLSEPGSYPGEMQLVPANGGAPERLRRWHSEARWRGVDTFTVSTGAVNTAALFTTSAVASAVIPDPGYQYNLRFYGNVRLEVGSVTGVDVIMKDGVGTGGAQLTPFYMVDGQVAGNASVGYGTMHTINAITGSPLVGGRTVSLVANKYKGSGGDGYKFYSESHTKIFIDIVPV